MKRSNMMGIATSFLLFFSISVHAQFKVVGYLYTWGGFLSHANNVDYSRVTHINIAFLNPDNSGTISPPNSLNSVVDIIHDHKVKVLASFGGAGSPNSWATLMAPGNRAAFITKMINFMNTYNLDGIDIDLEGSAIDINYNDFVVDLKASMPAGKLLTAAVATLNGGDIYTATLNAFDFINIMSYDNCGTWSSPCQHASYDRAVLDIKYWNTTRKVAKEKLILGLPSYGYSWEANKNTLFDYKTIVNMYPRAANQDSINTNTNGIIYHNSIPTIKQKSSYALENAGGIMWWALPYDYPTTDSRSLLRAMGEIVPSSVETIEGKKNLMVYPNPSASTITINFTASQKEDITISLFDLTGKKIIELFNGNIHAGNFSHTFDLTALSQGLYTCTISSEKSINVFKVVKE